MRTTGSNSLAYTGLDPQQSVLGLNRAFAGTPDDDSLTGTQFADYFDMSQGGQDTVSGGRGDDVFDFGRAFGNGDAIDGGRGFDTLNLDGKYADATITSLITGIEAIHLAADHSYFFYFEVAPARSLIIDATALGAGDDVHVYAGGISRIDFDFLGGEGSDTLIGGTGNDTFHGGMAADHIEGRGGHNVFVYEDVGESTSAGYDFVGLNPRRDLFSLPTEVTALDHRFAGGRLNMHDDARFDEALETKIDGTRLGADHALVFLPQHGNLGGAVFLIVDANGEAGYQAAEDFVFRLSGNGEDITLDNFVT
jgi:Ca2+-binding RTX toxin-like protein